MLARASNPVAAMDFRDKATLGPLPPYLYAHLDRATVGQGDPTGPGAACELKGAAGAHTELVDHGESGVDEVGERKMCLVKAK